jgi:hypothetical protein
MRLHRAGVGKADWNWNDCLSTVMDPSHLEPNQANPKIAGIAPFDPRKMRSTTMEESIPPKSSSLSPTAIAFKG